MTEKPKQEPSRPSSVRAAFASWWAGLGLLASSVSGFNLLRNVLDIRLTELLAAITINYQRVVHIPIHWLASWMHLPQPPSWAIDITLLWLLVGGVVLRSAWTLRSAAVTHGMKFPSEHKFWNYFLKKRQRLPQFLLFCVIGWPIAVFFLSAEPYVHRRSDQRYLFASKKKSLGFGIDTGANPYENSYEYQFDMRLVLAIQAVSAALAILAWVTLNAMLSLYG